MKHAPTLRNLRGNGAIWRASTKPWEIYRHIQTDPLPEIERSWGVGTTRKASLQLPPNSPFSVAACRWRFRLYL
jgi:hypothetical protein